MDVKMMLTTARGFVKYPGIRLTAMVQYSGEAFEEPLQFKIYPAGPRSKYEGQLQVKEDHPLKVNRTGVLGVEVNRWFGWVEEDGTYHASGRARPEEAEAISSALEEVFRDPLEAFRQRAKRHHSCCFCHRPLGDPHSRVLGYGMICAMHYGIPWKKTEKK